MACVMIKSKVKYFGRVPIPNDNHNSGAFNLEPSTAVQFTRISHLHNKSITGNQNDIKVNQHNKTKWSNPKSLKTGLLFA